MDAKSRILQTMQPLATLAAICLLSALAIGQVEKSGPWEMQDSRPPPACAASTPWAAE